MAKKMVDPVGKAKTACDRTIRSFVKSLEQRDNNSSLLVTTLLAAAGFFGARDCEENEVRYMAVEIANERGYEGRTAVNRKSEIRKVLRVHRTLPTAIQDYRDDHPTGDCGWIPAVKIAGALAMFLGDGYNGTKKERINSAVELALESPPANSGTKVPTTKAAQFVRAEKVCAEMGKMNHLPKGFRDEIRALRSKYLGD